MITKTVIPIMMNESSDDNNNSNKNEGREVSVRAPVETHATFALMPAGAKG